MSMTDRQVELTKRLQQLAAAYYQQDAPLVSDAEYDAIYDRLNITDEGIKINNLYYR